MVRLKDWILRFESITKVEPE